MHNNITLRRIRIVLEELTITNIPDEADLTDVLNEAHDHQTPWELIDGDTVAIDIHDEKALTGNLTPANYRDMGVWNAKN